MEDTPVISPDTTALVSKVGRAIDGLESFVVQSETDYLEAFEHVKRLKQLVDQVEAERMKATRPLDAAKKAIMDWFRPITDRAKSADAALNTAMLDYRREQARKKAEEIERLKALQLAEARRLEDISRQAEAIGRPEQADELRNRALDLRVAQPEPTTELPKVAGQSVRVTWKFRILDADQVPREFCVPDEKKLASMATRCGAQMRPGQIPGVEFYSVETLATRHGG